MRQRVPIGGVETTGKGLASRESIIATGLIVMHGHNFGVEFAELKGIANIVFEDQDGSSNEPRKVTSGLFHLLVQSLIQ